jgi:hypothetical protein
MDKAGLRKEYLRRDTSEFSMEKKANEVVVLDRLWDGCVFWGRTREWNILMTQARGYHCRNNVHKEERRVPTMQARTQPQLKRTAGAMNRSSCVKSRQNSLNASIFSEKQKLQMGGRGVWEGLGSAMGMSQVGPH